MIDNQGPVTAEEALQYDLESLEDSVDKSKQNIQLFRDTILTEEASVNNWRGMVAVLEPKKGSSQEPKNLKHDLNSLESSISKTKENIELLRDTITAEEATMDRYREMIAIIKANKKNKSK